MKEGVGGEGGEQSTTPIAPPLLPSAQQPRRARPVPGTRVTLQNAAALEEAQRCGHAGASKPAGETARSAASPDAVSPRRVRSGLEVSLRVHASRLLGLADRLLAASSAWDPTGQFFQVRAATARCTHGCAPREATRLTSTARLTRHRC